MLLNELCRAAGTTRKAVAYYEEQGLISPRRQENGYREFTPEDAQRVRRITLLRRLELSVEEIRGVLDGPEPEQVLRASLREKEGQARRLEACWDGLRLLIRKGADSREAEETISRLLVECESAARRLQAAFPGKYGDFIFLHFGRYLDTPVDTPEKAAAYTAITDFLDNLEETPMPEELAEQLRSACEQMSADVMIQADSAMDAALTDMESYLQQNKEAMEAYCRYRASPAFRESPAYALRRQLLSFQKAVGYADFLKNLELLSPAYKAYRERTARADEIFRRRFPEAAAVFDAEQAEFA